MPLLTNSQSELKDACNKKTSFEIRFASAHLRGSNAIGDQCEEFIDGVLLH
jgi:hypothetical protein